MAKDRKENKEIIPWLNNFQNIKPDICKNQFFEAKSVERWLGSGLGGCLFLSGNKGVGKSMLLILKRLAIEKYYEEKGESDEYKGILFLPHHAQYIDIQADLKNLNWETSWKGSSLCNKDKNGNTINGHGNARSLWSFALSLSILTSMGNRNHISEILDKFSNPSDKTMYDFLNTYFKQVGTGALQASRIIRDILIGKINKKQMEALLANVHHFTDMLAETHQAIFMFLDTTDEIDFTWENDERERSKDIWVNIQTGLVAAAYAICKQNSHIKIYTAIRQEAWDNYSATNRENVRGLICELNYEYELKAMLAYFFKKYEKKCLDDILGFKSLQSPHSCIDETPTQYIIRHTLCKPRSIVDVCKSVVETFRHEEIQNLPEEEKTEEFRAAVNKFTAHTMLKESFEENKYFLSFFKDYESDLPKFKSLLSLINCNVLDNIEIHAILKQLKIILGLDEGEDIHPFCDLYKMGFIGTIPQTAPDNEGGKQEFLNTFTKSIDRWVPKNTLPNRCYYLTHPSLSHWLTKDNGQRYYALVGIKTGENLKISADDIRLIKVQKSICKHRLDGNKEIANAAIAVLAGIRKMYKGDFKEKSLEEVLKEAQLALQVLYDRGKIDTETLETYCNVVRYLLTKIKIDETLIENCLTRLAIANGAKSLLGALPDFAQIGKDGFSMDDNLFTTDVQSFLKNKLNATGIKESKRLGGGKGGSQVFKFFLESHDSNIRGWRIAKLSQNKDVALYADVESTASQIIVDNAPLNFQKHLVKSIVLYYSNLQIIVSTQATGSNLNLKDLCDLPVATKNELIKKLSHDLLYDWNNELLLDKTVIDFFEKLLGKRLDKNGIFFKQLNKLLVDPTKQLIRFSLLSDEYPNPFYYITNPKILEKIINNATVQHFFVGKIHGDLHSQNVICNPKDTTGQEYQLIDFSHYQQTYILYDHALLETDHYFRQISNQEINVLSKKFAVLLGCVSEIEIEAGTEECEVHVTSFRNAICRSIKTWQEDKKPNDKDEINLQYACARLAAGIKYFCSPLVSTNTEGLKMLIYISSCLKAIFELLNYTDWLESDGTNITYQRPFSLDGIWREDR